MKLSTKMLGIPVGFVILVFVIMGVLILNLISANSAATQAEKFSGLMAAIRKQFLSGLSIVTSSSTTATAFLALEGNDDGLANDLAKQLAGMGLDALLFTDLSGKILFPKSASLPEGLKSVLEKADKKAGAAQVLLLKGILVGFAPVVDVETPKGFLIFTVRLPARSAQLAESEAMNIAADFQGEKAASAVGIAQYLEKEQQKADNQGRVFLRKMMITVTAIMLVSLLSMIIVFTLLTRSISGPIARTVELADAISRGDLSRRLNLNRSDEIGRLSRSLDAMADSLETKGKLAEAIAGGDLTREVQLSSADDSLGKSLQTMNLSLNQIIARINEAVEQVGTGSAQVSGSSQTLSQGATEQASSMEQITSSISEIGVRTNTNAENANQAETLTSKARQAAQAGVHQMVEVTDAMSAINESSKEIRKIISTIDSIAFQTNLLALNAAVEAARAGKHGKGFAVVAQEVRNLAGRSAKAAEETAHLIESAVKRIIDGNKIVEETSRTLAQIQTDVTTVADLVAEIASASNAQAQGIAEINKGLVLVDSVTQQNTSQAEETSAAAEALAGQAAHVKELLARFSLKTG